jgi:hypothetical protein
MELFGLQCQTCINIANSRVKCCRHFVESHFLLVTPAEMLSPAFSSCKPQYDSNYTNLTSTDQPAVCAAVLCAGCWHRDGCDGA